MERNILNKLALVISVYNEEDVLKILWAELEKNIKDLDVQYEVVFVNDGSTDRSHEILFSLSQKNNNIKVINLSANFGHEAAMTAGLEYSSGDAVIFMDADLQHPPSFICKMVEKFSEGYEIVHMVRTKNEDIGILKKILVTMFYFIFNLISPAKFEPNASDFFLISRRVADILKKNFCERTRFLRGLIQIIGFRKTTLEFVAPKRIAGTSSYNTFKLIALSIKAIATFSSLPLRIGVLCGVLFGIFSMLIGIFSIAMKLFGYVIPGYTTIVVLITFLFSIQFFITGIIGEYLGFLFNESKNRPIYIVQDEINIQGDND